MISTIMTKNTIEKPSKLSNDNDLDKLLEKDKKHNEKESWNKLSKTIKLRILNEYADAYADTQKLKDSEKVTLKEFLKRHLIQTKLLKMKDINYNKTTQKIEGITTLLFEKNQNRFTLKKTKTKTANKTVKMNLENK